MLLYAFLSASCFHQEECLSFITFMDYNSTCPCYHQDFPPHLINLDSKVYWHIWVYILKEISSIQHEYVEFQAFHVRSSYH